MKGLSKFLGRGLLVLALSSCFVACGDDDDGDVPDGGGGTGGTGAKGGTGGTAGKAGMGGKGGMGGASCEDAAEKASDTSVDTSPACIKCVCDKSEAAATKCTSDCWKLAYCVVSNGCDEDDMPCINSKCTDDLGSAAKLAAAGLLAVDVKFAECATQCFGADDGGN